MRVHTGIKIAEEAATRLVAFVEEGWFLEWSTVAPGRSARERSSARKQRRKPATPGQAERAKRA